MALNPSNSCNLEQLALKGLIGHSLMILVCIRTALCCLPSLQNKHYCSDAVDSSVEMTVQVVVYSVQSLETASTADTPA